MPIILRLLTLQISMEDERSSEEYLRDLDIEFRERALLKDHKAEYKKIKAKLALLEASPSTSQTPKTFQPKNNGLVAETFDWDEEEVLDDEEVTQNPLSTSPKNFSRSFTKLREQPGLKVVFGDNSSCITEGYGSINKHVPEVITLNEPDIPHTEDAEGPPNLINTEGTHEQNVQDEQIITQYTKGPSRNNTKVSVSIIESLVPDVPKSQLSNQASTSSHLVPQNRWSKDQHIKLANIIGFDLKGYSESDYAGCNMDRKSTSAESEYVDAAWCCASIIWMKSQLSDYDIHYKMGPKASGALSKKRQKPKSKKTPTETQVTPRSRLTEGFKQSHSVSSGNVPDLKRNIQRDGTIKTMPLPEGPLRDKDLEGSKPPADMEPITTSVADISGTGAKYQVDETQSTNIQAFILFEDEMAQESDDEDVFKAGEDMDEDTQANEEEHQSPPPNTDKPKPSHAQETQESDSNSSNQWEKHEESVVSYADLRASIEGYYKENIDNRAQTA
nr:hypothetical protein [Tanacetum cinerariifolium]